MSTSNLTLLTSCNVYLSIFNEYCLFQITTQDFNHYDFIFGMDQENMKDLNRKAPKGSKAKLLLFGDFDPQGDRIIRDPYYVSFPMTLEAIN